MKRKGADAVCWISSGLIGILILALAFYIVIALRETGRGSKIKEKTGKNGVETEEVVSSVEEPSSETQPVETTPEETLPEPAVHDETVEICRLSQEEIDAISASYDATARGFGTLGDRDENNRPVNVNDFMASFEGTEANVVCYCADENTKKVAFTFQAGMETGYTETVLDILNDYNIKSTFYVSHAYAQDNPGIVERMINENHEIGSHSYTCPEAGIAASPLEDQMSDALNLQTFMQTVYQYKMTKYNFNSSVWSPASVILMSKMGYEVCFFSANYADYDETAVFDVDSTLSEMENALHPGCVYCFHMTNEITVKILPALIEYCKDQGYSIVQLN